MSKHNYYVYITTNTINGKQYVGDHSTNDLNDKYLGSGTLIKKAISKYDLSNFKKEILEICESKKEAFNKQEKYINKYNTLSPNGYNISPTGGTWNGGFHSDSSKQKISKSTAGKKNGMYGKKHSKETKDKWSKNRKGSGSYMYGKTGEDCPNFGMKHSKETKDKWSKQRKGKTSGEKNGMFRKSNYSIWLEKYGKEIADKKLKERAVKASNSLKGRVISDETLINMRIAAKNRKNPEKIMCSYCKRLFDPGNFKQYHGNKCKSRKA